MVEQMEAGADGICVANGLSICLERLYVLRDIHDLMTFLRSSHLNDHHGKIDNEV
jgi:hypothetical protein